MSREKQNESESTDDVSKSLAGHFWKHRNGVPGGAQLFLITKTHVHVSAALF